MSVRVACSDLAAPIAATRVLFVGTPTLFDVDYAEIRALISTGLRVLSENGNVVRHLAITIHGPGYGLDESEALQSEILGIRDAFLKRELPESLMRISLVENRPGRVMRLRNALPTIAASIDGVTLTSSGELAFTQVAPGSTDRIVGSKAPPEPKAAEPEQKSHIFVAMPYDAELDDIFYYGIQQPIHRVGYICERCDQTAFTGEVLQRIMDRISDASLVVADLTAGNANVYLEVGYAWGKGVPTLLLARSEQSLLFDVRGHRCLFYDSIRDLDDKLGRQIDALRTNGVIRGPTAVR